MLFKLHYFFVTAGLNAIGILLGVYMATYTDATPGEIGLLYMLMPFVGVASRPIICSYADRQQAHRKYMIICELIVAISFFPFILIPILGPEVYVNHPRFCWYLLVSFKVVGAIAFGGVVSIGDSLAINYAKRIGTEFSIYRIWGTISWMIFGFIVGHLNEIWFLPKYAAGFIILVSAALAHALACYLWPKEYFVMVTPSMINKDNEQHEASQPGKIGLKSLTRSLMQKEEVWAHAKKQLWTLATCSCFSTASIKVSDRPVRVSQQEIADSHPRQQDGVDRATQVKTLLLLLRRDPRIIGYLVLFVGAGAALMPLSFFFMSLEQTCHTNQTCNFSQLAGYLQISMALLETFLFIYIKPVILAIGRINTLSLTFGLEFSKYLFYGTIWPGVNPHWSLLSESVSGIIFGTFLTIMVETGHLFSSEVEHLIPELIERGIISENDETTREKLKISLSATMQALFASANDGLGRGLAALVFGRILDMYSYRTLWHVIAFGSGLIVVVLQLVNMAESCCNLKFGLETKPTTVI